MGRSAATELHELQQDAPRRRAHLDVLELLYTSRHAHWAQNQEDESRPAAAAERLAHLRIERITNFDPPDTWALAADAAPDRQSNRPPRSTS